MAESKEHGIFTQVLAAVGYYAMQDPVNGRSPQAKAHMMKRNSPEKEKRLLNKMKGKK